MTTTCLARPVFAAMLVSAALAPIGAQQRHLENPSERHKYERKLLAYPNDEVPADVMARQIQLRIELSRRPKSTLLSLLGNSWFSIGPAGEMPVDGYYMSGGQLDAGRVVGIAIHPVNRDTWFIATAGGGVWKTTDAGASWAPMTDSQCILHTGAVAIDPKNPSIVYAGTGELDSWSFGCGVLRTIDGGTTWAPFVPSTSTVANAGGSIMAVGRIHIDSVTAGSASSTVLVMGAGFGVYRSTNSGVTWSRVLPAGRTNNVVAHPGNPDVLYAGVGDANATTSGIYRSVNKGANWTKLTPPPGLTTSGMARFGLAVSPGAPDKLWVVSAAFTGRLTGGFVWNNATSTWSSFNISPVYGTGLGARGDFGSQGTYDLLFAVDPADPNRIFMGGVRFYRSVDGGASWRQIANDIHVDWHAIAFDPVASRRIVASSDGGVFLSLDGGETWTSRNHGLRITQYYPGIALHPTDPGVVVGGAQDLGTHMSFGLPVWEGVGGGDGGFSAIDYADPRVMWRTCQWLPGACIDRRNTSGQWQGAGTGIVTNDNAEFIPPLVMDPTTSTTLYFGTNYLYKNTIVPASWTKISPDLTKNSGAGIMAIAPSKSQPLTIYVGTGDGNVRVTQDGGTTWGAASATIPNRTVTDIWVDPTDHLKAWATVAGFDSPHVWQTTNGGTTWTSISGNLPNVPVHAVAYVPSENLLMVGTEVGVYQSGDGGATWSAGPSGLPMVRVTDLAYNATTGIIVAGTYGRGMWRYNLGTASPVLRGDVDGSGVIDAFDVLLIQKALIGASLGNDGGGQPYRAMPRGDTDCNGRLEAVDALLALQKSVGQTPAACVGQTQIRRD